MNPVQFQSLQTEIAVIGGAIVGALCWIALHFYSKLDDILKKLSADDSETILTVQDAKMFKSGDQIRVTSLKGEKR